MFYIHTKESQIPLPSVREGTCFFQSWSVYLHSNDAGSLFAALCLFRRKADTAEYSISAIFTVSNVQSFKNIAYNFSLEYSKGHPIG